MNFDWQQYLELAKELGGRPEESARRTSVSRAYYSAYHAANESLKKNKVSLDMKRNTHERVWDVYCKSANVECNKIGNLGFRLKNARIDADYKSQRTPSPKRVQHTIQEAERIIQSVPQHLPEGVDTIKGQTNKNILDRLKLFVESKKFW